MSTLSFDERLAVRALREIKDAESAIGAAALLFGHDAMEFRWLRGIMQQLREFRGNHPLVTAVVPDEVRDGGWQWRPVDADTAFAPPFSTIRVCRACGCLVAGGPTACGRCVAVEAAKPAGAEVSP